ncbi:MAG TPA: Ig-like domain-containing protein [Gallionella sp.]|nr:Ig-like domain-containing protein [Gallionella sp.]
MFIYLAAILVVLLILVRPEDTPAPSVPSSLKVKVGNTASIKVSGVSGEVSARSSDKNIATVSCDHGVATVRGLSAGAVTVTLWDRENSQRVSVAVVPAAGAEVASSDARAPMI